MRAREELGRIDTVTNWTQFSYLLQSPGLRPGTAMKEGFEKPSGVSVPIGSDAESGSGARLRHLG